MFKSTFSLILASTALIAQEAHALTWNNINDPLSLSQTQTSGAITAQSILQNSLQQSQQVQQLSQVQVKNDDTTASTTQTEPTQSELDAKYNSCVTNLTQTYFAGKDTNGTAVATTGLEQFNNWVDNICPSLDMRMPNGVITAACFHSGYFMLKMLRPMADAAIKADAPVDADGQNIEATKFGAYIDDFCTSYIDVMPERTLFVKTVRDITTADEFNVACTTHLAGHSKLNTWFDPIDPLSSITQREICDLHFKLFASLKEKQRSSLAEYVSFSYLASLDLYLNAQAQEDYENCVNQEVIANPNQWVTQFTGGHPAYKNWQNDKMINESADVGVSVKTTCADSVTCMNTGSCSTCNGCSIAISRIQKAYEEYLNNLFAETFKRQSETMFNKLHEANLLLETAAQ